jgi:hypothetical protein
MGDYPVLTMVKKPPDEKPFLGTSSDVSMTEI